MSDFFRTSRRLAALSLAILGARFGSKGSHDPASRAAWQQHQAQRMLAALEIDVSIAGCMPRGGLLVCNHLGYLDVLVIAAQGPVLFVAKSDVRKWPVIGNLLDSSGTILAERGRPLTARATATRIRTALEDGLTVVFFPEGTSSDGSTVLPFKPSLLQAALDAAAPVTPAAISYQADGGDAAHDVCYWGDATFLPHLVRLARLRKIQASLNIGRTRGKLADRKSAANQLHKDVATLLMELSE
jgi:1-acyl-sn-glycerol-3-phosphate acyltransferase